LSDAPTEAELYGKPIAGRQPLNVGVRSPQGREADLLREVGEVWVGKHGHVPEQLVAHVRLWFQQHGMPLMCKMTVRMLP
jgi:hypothetical protein